jgi:D5 N terminal like
MDDEEYVMVPLPRPWPRDLDPPDDTCIVTSPCERDENGVAIIPFPGPTRAEILELRTLSNDKRYTQDDRQKFSQIADTMEGATAERPEPAGNGADDDYDAPGEPASREDISPEFSEDRLALRFADRHGNDLRYVAEWGKWLAWTGTCWDIEKTLLAPHRAREICRQAASECNNPSESKAIVKWRTVNAVETMARSDRRIAAIVSQWDADQSLLNMQKTSIKLSTGVERSNYKSRAQSVPLNRL